MANAPAVNISFISTKRGGETLVVEDYTFRVNRTIGTKRYWKCHTSGCKVSAVTDGHIVVKRPTTALHCHPNEEIEVARQEFRHEVHNQV